MSAGNMGISQLECLQLRNLVGPAGIGAVSNSQIGSTHGDVVVAQIPLNLRADGSADGDYISTFTVPSGTGMMRVQVQTNSDGGSVVAYNFFSGESVSVGLPKDVAIGAGYSGWFYQGLMYYNNPSSSPATVVLNVVAQGSTQACRLLFFQVRTISFGPYVQQE